MANVTIILLKQLRQFLLRMPSKTNLVETPVSRNAHCGVGILHYGTKQYSITAVQWAEIVDWEESYMQKEFSRF